MEAEAPTPLIPRHCGGPMRRADTTPCTIWQCTECGYKRPVPVSDEQLIAELDADAPTQGRDE